MTKKKSRTQKQKHKIAKKLSKSFSKQASIHPGGNKSSEPRKTLRRARPPEEDEFRRQQRSLFEREEVIQWKRNVTKQPTIEIHKERFTLRKTTEQLVEETTLGVEALVGYGNSGLRPGANVAAWANHQTQKEKEQIPIVHRNPWDVLDDEEQEHDQTPSEQVPILQFAAPSFQFQLKATTNYDTNDPDPDL